MESMKKILISLCARGCGMLGGVLLSIVVARLTGTEGLGSFAVFLGVIGSLGILARRGQDRLLIRAVAIWDCKAHTGTTIALLFHGISKALIPSILLGVLGSALLASGLVGTAFPTAVGSMPIALPLLTILALISGYTKGRSRAWLAPLFEIGGVSLIAGIALIVISFYAPISSGSLVMWALIGALLFLLLTAAAMILRDMPNDFHIPILDRDQKAELRAGEVDFTLIALATFLTQAGAFLLAAPFLPEADLGLLRAAERLALLVSFSVLAINPVIAPRIVRLSRGGDPIRLRRLTGRAMLASTGIAACVLVPLVIWPGPALALMGPEFTAAVPYLRVMACAQLLAAAIGPLAMMLNMSGRERLSMWINLATLALAAALVPGLSLAYGATGFAVAYAAIILARTLLVIFAVIHDHIKLKHAIRSRV
jgi:O-antigen/teichoic acid export membrane protein